eukprot:9701798-Alexandrium_andersonii.AAC.1
MRRSRSAWHASSSGTAGAARPSGRRGLCLDGLDGLPRRLAAPRRQGRQRGRECPRLSRPGPGRLAHRA